MGPKTFVVRGDRWTVQEEEAVDLGIPTYRSYRSETPPYHRIVFVHPISRKRREADWHNPLSQCDIEDLQIMFETSRPAR
ncbi:MAG: hypothetical protein ACE5FP_02505 [Gemmatimonadota bacterium]